MRTGPRAGGRPPIDDEAGLDEPDEEDDAYMDEDHSQSPASDCAGGSASAMPLEDLLKLAGESDHPNGGASVDAERPAVPQPSSKKASAAEAALPPGLFDPSIQAVRVEHGVTLQADTIFPPPDEHEVPSRARLARAMMGLSGPVGRLRNGTLRGDQDCEIGRGVADGLAAGSDDLAVRLLSELAAAQYLLAAKVAGAAAHAAEDRYKPGVSGRAALDYSRALGQLTRNFERTVEAIEIERARKRDVLSIPRFVVRAVKLAKPKRGGAPS
jgi:hypothetical protein